VVVLKANISAFNLMRAAIGNQCNFMRRGVMYAQFSSLKISLATAFWISCRDLTVDAGRPAERALQKSSLDRRGAWTRSCVAH